MSEVWTRRVDDLASAEAINADVAALFKALADNLGEVRPATLIVPARNWRHIQRVRRRPQFRNAMRQFPFKRLCLTSPLALMRSVA